MTSDIIVSEADLSAILANFAVQLYYQQKEIDFKDNYVLAEFLQGCKEDDFYPLITELLGAKFIACDTAHRLSPVLCQRVQLVNGEDTLGFVYISLRDIAQRKSTGMYYTKAVVVDQLIGSLYSNYTDLACRTICDPCCGTGNFLMRLVARGVPCEMLYGQDVDPTSVYIARINLALSAPNSSASVLRAHITVGNTFFKPFDISFDVVLGNPPWGSDFSDEDILQLAKLYTTAQHKNFEAYELFVEKSLSMLSTGGVLAFVLPEAILSVASHSAIREILYKSCSFKFVSYLGEAFSGVQCPSIILGVCLNNFGSTAGCRVFTEGNSFVIERNRLLDGGEVLVNISDEEYECLSFISNLENTVYLKDNAKFALGIVTGSNRQYISSEQKEGWEPVLKGSDIYRYGIKLPCSYIFFKPSEFQQVAPTAMYRAEEKLLYRFISRVPVFAYDNAQTLSLNSCNILIPQISGMSIRYILAVLNSSVSAYFVLKKFNSVKLLRSHLEQIPIPIVSAEIQQSIIKKVDNIMYSNENTKFLYEELDDEIMELYMLTKKHRELIRLYFRGKNLFLK